MNGDHRHEVVNRYVDGDYSYPVCDCFGDYFDGVSAAPLPYSATALEPEYWSIHMNSYRYGAENMYHAPVMDHLNVRDWDFSLVAEEEHPVTAENVEHSSTDQDAESTQILWQDEIDPDNMTYEELLDLGEVMGRESRGLSQELINLLPTSKHKSSGIFSRRKSEDRCIICQMRYKRGDRLINLPCKHAYHAHCGSKWLSINKTCPVCNIEVIFS